MTEEKTPINGTLAYRVTIMEKALLELQKKVDRLTMAIVGASLSFAVGVGVFAVTLLNQGS